MKKIVFLAICFSLFAHISWAQTPSIMASVDKTTVPLGQSFNLEVVYQNQEPPQPDTSLLQNDFEVVGVAQGKNIQIINGAKTVEYSRQFRLIPKGKGQLSIPVFTDENGNKTEPITINVIEPSEISAQGAENGNQFAMVGRVNNNTPYVQQEILYTISLTDSGGLQGREPLFELANDKDWVIRSLGIPEIKPFVKNGKKMREIIFKYAFFPQKSGKLLLPAARFEGYALGKPQKRIDPFADLFGDELGATLGMTFADHEPVFLKSAPIEIDVRPIPLENNGNWWLPAQDVLLVDKWENENPQIKVGEALHRTIYLKADGVLDNQLPSINFPETKGLKQYPEKPAMEMKAENGHVTSVMKISNVYIPNATGDIEIPAIEIPWFNVNTKQMETAKLKGRKISVIPNPEIKEAEVMDTVPTPEVQEPALPKSIAKPQLSENDQHKLNSHLYLVLMAVGGFALGIILTLLLVRKGNHSAQGQAKSLEKAIFTCAKNKDIRGLRDALLDWSKEKFSLSYIKSFNELKEIIKDKDFADELDKINAQLYSDNLDNWDYKVFLNVFEKVNKNTTKKKNTPKILPDLYK